LESEHSSQSEQSARDNENDLELAVGGNDWFYNLSYCFYCLSEVQGVH
jgi:hypothetical protein